MSQAVSFYDGAIDMVTLKNKYTLSAWLSIVVGLAVVMGMGRAGFRTARGVKILCMCLLFVDLFFYGFNSIKPNYMPFDSIGTDGSESAIIGEIKRDASLFRVSQVYGELWRVSRSLIVIAEYFSVRPQRVRYQKQFGVLFELTKIE